MLSQKKTNPSNNKLSHRIENEIYLDRAILSFERSKRNRDRNRRLSEKQIDAKKHFHYKELASKWFYKMQATRRVIEFLEGQAL